MKKLVLTSDNLIVSIADSVEETPNGRLIKERGMEYFLAFPSTVIDVVEHNVPVDFESGKYIFLDGTFKENPQYVTPPRTQEELEQEIETLKLMVAELGLMVGGGL